MDDECVILYKQIQDGFPAKKESISEKIRQFWPMRHDLYEVDGVPFKGKKILIPRKLRGIVLEGLHAGHQGTTSMRANARERFFWPGLDAAITNFRAQCRSCKINAPSRPVEPFIITPPPEYPFEQAVIDLCFLEGHDFLVYADRYSGLLEVAKLKRKNWNAVQEALLRWFMTFGVPTEISADKGPRSIQSPTKPSLGNGMLNRETRLHITHRATGEQKPPLSHLKEYVGKASIQSRRAQYVLF